MTKQERVTSIATFVVASVLVFLRQLAGSTAVTKSVWAEDGWIPLCVVSRGSGRCLAEQVNGYWPIVHRLLAEPLALIPMGWWPLVFPLLAALLISLLVLSVFQTLRHVGGIPSAIAGSLGIVLIPTLGMEFINVLGNIHWVILMAAMVIMISPIREKRFGVVLLLVFVAGIANPASFVLVILVALLRISRVMPTKQALKIGAAALTGWLLQVLAVLVFKGTDRVGTSFTLEEKMLNVVNSFLGVIPGLRIDSTQSVSFLATSTRLTPYVGFAVLLTFLIVLIMRRGTSHSLKAFASFGLTTQALSIFLLLILDPNPRYVFVVIALNLIWVVGMIGASVRRTRVMYLFALALALLSLPGFAAGPYRSTPSDVSWSDQLENARIACAEGAETVEFHFAPERSYPTVVNCSRL